MAEEENEGCFTEELEDLSSVALTISVIGLVGSIFLTFVLGTAFFCLRNKSSILRERANFILFLNIIGINVQAAWPVDSLRQRQGSPCILYVNMRMFIVSLMIVPALFSTIRVFAKFKLNKSFAERYLAIATYEQKGEPASSPISSFNDDLKTAGIPKNSQIKVLSWLSDTKFMSSVLFILTAVTVSVALGSNYKLINCKSPCETNSKIEEFVYLAIAGGLTAVGMTYFMLSVRKEPDPLGFRKQIYFLAVVTAVLAVPVTVLTGADPGDLRIRGRIRWGDVWVLVCCIYIVLFLGYPLFLARNQIRRKKDLKLEDKLSLEAVLASETGRTAFKAFLVNELNVEHFLFWNDVRIYKENFEKRGKGRNVLLRKQIMDTFINQTSALQINISAFLRNEVRQKLEHDPSVDDFDEALKAVIELLQFDAFRRFTQTSIYKGLSWDEAL